MFCALCPGEFCEHIEFMIYENRVKSANKPRLKICNHRIDTTLRSVRRELILSAFPIQQYVLVCLYLPRGKIHRKQTKSKFTRRAHTPTHILSLRFPINMSVFCYNNGKLIFSEIFGLNVNIFGDLLVRSFVLSAPFNHSLYFFVLTLGSVFKARKTNFHGVRALNYGFVNNPRHDAAYFFPCS